MMVYHDLPLGWLAPCKPASMQITLRINTSELLIDAGICCAIATAPSVVTYLGPLNPETLRDGDVRRSAARVQRQQAERSR